MDLTVGAPTAASGREENGLPQLEEVLQRYTSPTPLFLDFFSARVEEMSNLVMPLLFSLLFATKHNSHPAACTQYIVANACFFFFFAMP